MPNRRLPATQETPSAAKDLRGLGSIDQGLLLMSKAGSNVDGAAWDKIVERFASTRSRLSGIEWSDDFKQARSWAAPSEGGEPYRVAIWISPGEAPCPQAEGDPVLSEFWGALGWSAFGGCHCPFSGSTHMAVCKHLGALAQWAGEAAGAMLISREIRQAIGEPSEESCSPAPGSKPRL